MKARINERWWARVKTPVEVIGPAKLLIGLSPLVGDDTPCGTEAPEPLAMAERLLDFQDTGEVMGTSFVLKSIHTVSCGNPTFQSEILAGDQKK